MTDKIGAVMVVGGGVTGIQASLDLANSGYKVYLVDKEPSILHCRDDEENQNKKYASPLKNSSLTRDIPLYVDFNDKNILNNSRNFPIVNSLLKIAIGKWPDFEKVKSVYERINNDSSAGIKGLLDAFD